MAKDYLEEYLVKLGWEVNTSGLDDIKKKTASFIEKYAPKFIKSLASVASAGVATFSAITDSIVSLVDITAKADAETNKLALRYFTTAENMRAFNNALATMGIEYEDLFFTTEEERKNFEELYNLGKSLEVPAGLEDTLITIRSIGQQINKLKIVAQSFFRAVVYYLGRISGDKFTSYRDKLSKFVDRAIEKMPRLAEGVARFLSLFVDLSDRIFTFIKNVPTGLKLVSALFLAFLTGPVGKVIAGLTMAFLLIEDFMYWKAGKRSALDWGGFSRAFEPLTDNLDSLKEKFSGIKDDISEMLDKLGIPEDMRFSWVDMLALGIEALTMAIEGANAVLSPFVSLLEDIDSLISGDLKLKDIWTDMWEGLKTDASNSWGQLKKSLGVDNETDRFTYAKAKTTYENLAALDYASVDNKMVQLMNSMKSKPGSIVNMNTHDTYNVNTLGEAEQLHSSVVRDFANTANAMTNPGFE